MQHAFLGPDYQRITNREMDGPLPEYLHDDILTAVNRRGSRSALDRGPEGNGLLDEV
jgi:hypothetical protein